MRTNLVDHGDFFGKILKKPSTLSGSYWSEEERCHGRPNPNPNTNRIEQAESRAAGTHNHPAQCQNRRAWAGGLYKGADQGRTGKDGGVLITHPESRIRRVMLLRHCVQRTCVMMDWCIAEWFHSHWLSISEFLPTVFFIKKRKTHPVHCGPPSTSVPSLNLKAGEERFQRSGEVIRKR